MKLGVSYFGVRNPDLAKVDLLQMRDLGYTHVLHTISEEDLEYYADTMREIIRASVRYGLTVYVNPWGVGHVFGGEAYSELASRYPEAAQRNNMDQQLVASCPNSPIFREYMAKWIDFVASTEAETIFWDEPHFHYTSNRYANKSEYAISLDADEDWLTLDLNAAAHSTSKSHPGEGNAWACCCKNCQKLFFKQYKHSMPTSMSETVDAFRQESLWTLLDDVTRYAREKGKRNTLCLLPHEVNSGINDWERMADLEAVDEIATNPYWGPQTTESEVIESYGRYSRELLALAQSHGKEAQIWIKNFQLLAGQERLITASSWQAYNSGIRNIFAWAYKGCDFHKLRCANPEAVWETTTQTFDEIRQQAEKSRA